MKVCWKGLIIYGILFWIILCITDYLKVTPIHRYIKEFDELYEKPKVMKQIEQHLDPHLNKFQYKGFKLGFSSIAWNFVTFVFSVFACSIGRTCIWTFWTIYQNYRHLWFVRQSVVHPSKSFTGISKIPIIMKTVQQRSSDTAIAKHKSDDHFTSEQSCPNLIGQKNNNNLLTIPAGVTKAGVRTVWKEDLAHERENTSYKWQLENQCTRLKEELQQVQSNSLKEQSALFRKLNLANKAKKDLSDQIVEMQKENRAAKQEMEYLIDEKANLLKKLDNATKEFKTNTKTRKFALVKLEEMTHSMEELRQQLEQATRDKEILEKKLALLDIEYNKLHERYLILRGFNNERNSNMIEVPERDENNNKRICLVDKLNSNNMTDNSVPRAMQQTVNALVSVSQTEIDMRKIQEKIKQLEKNLELFNADKSADFEIDEDSNKYQSEVSLTGFGHTTGSQETVDHDSISTLSEYSNNNSPRPKYWSNKVSEAFGKYKDFARLRSLANQTQNSRSNFLGNFTNSNNINALIQHETTDSEEREPKRLVSSSAAFQNFMKNLKSLKAVKREIPAERNNIF